MNVLSATTTRREAKSYISRFKPKDRVATSSDTGSTTGRTGILFQDGSLDRLGVNLGGFYATTRAAEQTPRFSQHALEEETISSVTGPSHIALVKIRVPQFLNDKTLDGIGSTLSQLAKLGMTSAIVLDCDDNDTTSSLSTIQWRDLNLTQTDRLVSSINAYEGHRGRRVVDAVGVSSLHQPASSIISIRGEVEIQYPELFSAALRNGTLPVVPGIAYTTDTQKATRAGADEILLALTRSFTGIASGATTIETHAHTFVLEKVIILDPLGGTPYSGHSKRSRVFINLEQEFPGLCQELQKRSDNGQHIKNLELVRDALALLPPTSSALITSPEDAARSANLENVSRDPLGVSTRPVKNPLIHNLLTDKPAFSSSLPTARIRIGSDESRTANPLPRPTTFIKRGMPLSIIPDPRNKPWIPPSPPNHTTLDLQDPQIAFPRLVHLIEDSFARPLNVRHYLARIHNHVAGVIIAGEYEGGAILTWEAPPSATAADSSPSNASPAPTRLVPYLDKFAVLQRSQGSGASVADIVFKAMVRDCFPSGVVWRSRRNNPVNQWYFERSVGTWKIPGSNWCMFWTTPGIFDGEDDRRWEDYVDVCRNVKASWADDKAAD